MTNKENANLYDEYIRKAGMLERENSKLKSQYVTNILDEIQRQINNNQKQIDGYTIKLNNLLRRSNI